MKNDLKESLTSAFEGDVIDAAHPEYDSARKVWNGAIDRRPSAIVRVASAEDVVRAVTAARSLGRPLCVRGGGHSAPGHSVMDGELTIDLARMRRIDVDVDRRVARVEAGALFRDLDRATAEHGLATTGGLVSHTGVAGLTLGGGIGWLMRKHGLTIDNLLGADVVVAGGSRLRASATENPDLFWALRGGGGNFGVVTSFDFRLHSVRTVLGGMVIHPASRARELLRFYRDFVATAPDELTTVFAFITAPPAPFIPEALRGTPVVAIVVCHAGEPARGAEALRSIVGFGPPAVNAISEMPYVALQSMLDDGAPHGLHYYMKSATLDALSDRAVDELAARATAATSPLTQVHLHHMGGAVARVADDATAYGPRGAQFVFNVVAAWSGAASTERHVTWSRGLFDVVASEGSAAYVNFLGDEGNARVRAAYGAEKYARLTDVKRRYDPTNVFRFNQNIRATD